MSTLRPPPARLKRRQLSDTCSSDARARGRPNQRAPTARSPSCHLGLGSKVTSNASAQDKGNAQAAGFVL